MLFGQVARIVPSLNSWLGLAPVTRAITGQVRPTKAFNAALSKFFFGPSHFTYFSSGPDITLDEKITPRIKPPPDRKRMKFFFNLVFNIFPKHSR